MYIVLQLKIYKIFNMYDYKNRKFDRRFPIEFKSNKSIAVTHSTSIVHV